jgi:hypothetical protein
VQPLPHPSNPQLYTTERNEKNPKVCTSCSSGLGMGDIQIERLRRERHTPVIRLCLKFIAIELAILFNSQILNLSVGGRSRELHNQKTQRTCIQVSKKNKRDETDTEQHQRKKIRELRRNQVICGHRIKVAINTSSSSNSNHLPQCLVITTASQNNSGHHSHMKHKRNDNCYNPSLQLQTEAKS